MAHASARGAGATPVLGHVVLSIEPKVRATTTTTTRARRRFLDATASFRRIVDAVERPRRRGDDAVRDARAWARLRRARRREAWTTRAVSREKKGWRTDEAPSPRDTNEIGRDEKKEGCRAGERGRRGR